MNKVQISIRKPLGELDPNTLISSTKRLSIAEPTNSKKIIKGEVIYENLMRKTKDMQNDLEQMKSGFLKENRKRCNSFISLETPCNQQQLLREKGKLMELNENLMRNNSFLSNKIRLLEERELFLLKIIEQLRNNKTKEPIKTIKSSNRDELISLFSKY